MVRRPITAQAAMSINHTEDFLETVATAVGMAAALE